jgi:conjugal transfer pilus assembly protein TraE
MKLPELSDAIAFRLGISKVVQLLLVGSFVLNIILAVTNVMADRTHRETMVPPEIHKTFWVEDQHVSPEYLEQMGTFLLELALNNSPASAEYNAKMLLKYAAPASYGELEKILLANAKRLKDDNASTVYSPRSISIGEKTNTVVFSGVLSTYIAEKRVSQTQLNYLIKLGYQTGRVYVIEMRETDSKQPFKDLVPDPLKQSGETQS